MQCLWVGHLDGHVLALLHGEDCHLYVVLPGGHDVDEVDVVSLAELLPAFLTAVLLGMGTAGLFQDLLSGGGSLGIEVAEGLDLRALDVGETLHCAGASHAQADEAYAHYFHGLDGESENGFLAVNPGRYLEYYLPVLNVIGNGTVTVLDRVAGCSGCECGGQCQCEVT